jgi:hypothetical protein
MLFESDQFCHCAGADGEIKFKLFFRGKAENLWTEVVKWTKEFLSTIKWLRGTGGLHRMLQLSRYVPADTGLSCDKAVALRNAIKRTLYPQFHC